MLKKSDNDCHFFQSNRKREREWETRCKRLPSCDQGRRAVCCRCCVLSIALRLGCNLFLQRQQLVHKILNDFRMLLLLCLHFFSSIAFVRRHVSFELRDLLVLGKQLLVFQAQLLLQGRYLLTQLRQHHHMIAAVRVQQAAGLWGAPQRGTPVCQLGRIQPWSFGTSMITANLVVGER